MPIIVLSVREREIEKIEALDLGADDYVNKPFNVGELLACSALCQAGLLLCVMACKRTTPPEARRLPMGPEVREVVF